MQIQVAEYYAQTRSYKGTLNKIHRAKRGLPTSGKLPYGRTFDKKTEKWGVDPEKKKLLQKAAKLYLNGGSFFSVGKKVNIAPARLMTLLKHRSGDSWEIHFNIPRFKIDEKIIIKVPRLLPEKTIKAIHERAESNKTWTHGKYKNENLLSRFVFCGHCKAALSVHQGNGYRYYTHRWGTSCKRFSSIKAETLEDAVLVHLFKTFGDVKALEQAAKKAIPDLDEVKELETEITENEKELKKIKRAKGRLMDYIEEDCIDSDISGRMKKHRERQEALKAENRSIKAKLAEIPTERDITMKAQLLQRMAESWAKNPDCLVEMSFEEKRKLVETVLAGKDSEGNRFGVYLEKRKDATKYQWMFSIRGNLIDEIENLPMSKDAMRATLGIEDPNFDPLKGFIVDNVSYNWEM